MAPTRAVPDSPYLSLLTGVPLPRLIFIMGDHRSGTTLLYKILGETGCFNIVTAYHIIHQNELLYHHVHHTTEETQNNLSKLFNEKGLSTRIFDGIAISPEMPEEYGFVLNNTDPRPHLTSENAENFISFCKKVQLLSKNNKPLLLKNPWDYFLNFMQVKEIFPDSQFIFIGRHPLQTINSQLKATRSLFEEKNEYVSLVANWYAELHKNSFRLWVSKTAFSQNFEMGFRLVFRHVLRASSYFLSHIHQLEDQQVIKIKYEDLCQNSKVTVDRMMDALKQEMRSEPNFQTLIQPRSLELLPEVNKNQVKISKKLAPYLAYWNY